MIIYIYLYLLPKMLVILPTSHHFKFDIRKKPHLWAYTMSVRGICTSQPATEETV